MTLERGWSYLPSVDVLGREPGPQFVPYGGGAPRPMWSAEMETAAYEALPREDRKWLAKQWEPVRNVRPDIGDRFLA